MDSHDTFTPDRDFFISPCRDTRQKGATDFLVSQLKDTRGHCGVNEHAQVLNRQEDSNRGTSNLLIISPAP